MKGLPLAGAGPRQGHFDRDHSLEPKVDRCRAHGRVDETPGLLLWGRRPPRLTSNSRADTYRSSVQEAYGHVLQGPSIPNQSAHRRTSGLDILVFRTVPDRGWAYARALMHAEVLIQR